MFLCNVAHKQWVFCKCEVSMCRVAVGTTKSLRGASDATLYCCFGPSAISEYYNSGDLLQPLHQKMLVHVFRKMIVLIFELNVCSF